MTGYVPGEDNTVKHEDCEECGGTLEKTSDTVSGSGVAASFEAECRECGHKQTVVSY